MASGSSGGDSFISKAYSYSGSIGGWSNGAYQRSNLGWSSNPSGYVVAGYVGFGTDNSNCSIRYANANGTWVLGIYNQNSSSVNITAEIRPVFAKSDYIGS